jgi:hypothetical protein
MPASRKDALMWVFDGEDWTEEGGSSGSGKGPEARPRFDEFTPELQVIEIVPVPRTNQNDLNYPLLPLP